jgi:iron complex outermembrane receptor protein
MKSISYAALLTVLINTPAYADSPTEIVIKGHKPEHPPTTTESATAEDIARTTNAVTPEDALRYLPNVLVRQRHIGDTQSPVTTRTSGVGASARSLIYVDGILISALVGNNNTTASPKWGLIPAEAIDRVDVLYGPFSAAYPGNALGSTINITTRMPATREGSIEVQGASQAFRLYGDKARYGTGRIAGSYGDRFGRLAFRLSGNHLDSEAQPLAYATAVVPAANSAGGTPVTGALDDTNRAGAAIKVFGSTGLEHQVQDNLSGRTTYDLSGTVTAAYTFGLFHNHDAANVVSYLRDGSGKPVYAGSINIDNKSFTLSPSIFASGVYDLGETQLAQGLSLTSHSGGRFDFDLTASGFTYLDSRQRGPAVFGGNAGTDTVLNGTGWLTLDAKGLWRTVDQTVSFGAHQDDFRLNSRTFNLADWNGGVDGALKSASLGRSETQAVWIEDAWRWSPRTTATLGLRAERWRTRDATIAGAAQPRVRGAGLSPKAVIAWTPDAWTVKVSLAEAYRFPTVSELYQAVTTGTVLSVPNPNLRPERAVSAELSAGRTWHGGEGRVSVFGETIADALLSQTGVLNGASASFVQNVDRTRALGVEVVAAQQVGPVDLAGWLTLVDARIVKDAGFAAAVGKTLPQLPKVRGAVTATWSPSSRWDIALAARYSARAFGTVDNSDRRADTYQGFAAFFVADAHVRYRVDRHLVADIGVDNLNNRRYLEFHPFPQRTVIAALKYSL